MKKKEIEYKDPMNINLTLPEDIVRLLDSYTDSNLITSRSKAIIYLFDKYGIRKINTTISKLAATTQSQSDPNPIPTLIPPNPAATPPNPAAIPVPGWDKVMKELSNPAAPISKPAAPVNQSIQNHPIPPKKVDHYIKCPLDCNAKDSERCFSCNTYTI